MELPWLCESCSHKWKDSVFVTWIDCPKCGSEETYHGNVIVDDEKSIGDANEST